MTSNAANVFFITSVWSSQGGKAIHIFCQHVFPVDTSVNNTLKHIMVVLGLLGVNITLNCCIPVAIGFGDIGPKVPAAIGKIVTVALPGKGLNTVISIL